MGLALTLARRSLSTHPGRAIFSILGVAVGIATAVAVFTLDHVTVLSRTTRLDPGFGADLEVRPSSELEDPKSRLLALEGVAGVAAFFQNDVRVRSVASGAPEVRARLVALEEGSGPSLGVYHVERGIDLSPKLELIVAAPQSPSEFISAMFLLAGPFGFLFKGSCSGRVFLS